MASAALSITRGGTSTWKLACLGSLTLAVAFSFWTTIGKPDCMDLDFGAYYRAAKAVVAGQSPYQVDEHGPMGTFAYAPAFAFLLIPLTCLDYLDACRVFLAFNWLVMAAAIWLAFRLVRSKFQIGEEDWPMLFTASLPLALYFWANLRVGQVGGIMTALCLGWAVCSRSGRPVVGGMLLSTACALKLAPALFLPWLIWKRDWRGVAGVVIGSALLLLMPAGWVGLEGAADLHREWIAHTQHTQIPEQTYRPGNQSLLGQLARLPMIGNGHECWSAENLEALYQYYPLLLLGLTGVLYGGLLLSNTTRGELWGLALVFIFMTLAHPRGWRCNFVGLLLPCMLLADVIVRILPGRRVALLALVGLLLACGWPTHGIGEEGWSLLAWLILGKHFWAGVAVALACLRCAALLTNLSGFGSSARGLASPEVVEA